MVIDELTQNESYKLISILDRLYEDHNVVLDFSKANFNSLIETLNHYDSLIFSIMESTSPNTYLEKQSYQEACLIQEAIRLFLSEVAPKRLKKSSRKAK